MGLSTNTYVYTGGDRVFPVSFALGFLNKEDVTVYVEGELDGLGEIIYRQFTWNSDNEIVVTDPITADVSNPKNVVIQRTVSKSELVVDFTQEGTATRHNIQYALSQAMMAIHEFIDGRIQPLESVYPFNTYIVLIKQYIQDATTTYTELSDLWEEHSAAILASIKNNRVFSLADQTTVDLVSEVLDNGDTFWMAGLHYYLDTSASTSDGAPFDGARPFGTLSTRHFGGDLRKTVEYAEANNISFVYVEDDWSTTTGIATNSDLTLKGRGNPLIKFTIAPTDIGFHVQSGFLQTYDFRIEVELTGGIGSNAGDKGTCVTTSYYFDTSPLPECKYRATGMTYIRSGASSAHALANMGNTSLFDVQGCMFEGDGTGKHLSMMLAHWGAQGAGYGQAITGLSYHPNNITLKNCVGKNVNEYFLLSSTYDVSIENLTLKTPKKLFSIVPGDETDFYASAGVKPLIGTGITITDLNFDVMSTPSGAPVMDIRSLGFSQTRLDNNGASVAGQLFWSGLRIENICGSVSQDDAKILAMDAVQGDLSFKNIKISGVADNIISVDVDRIRGSVHFECCAFDGIVNVEATENVYFINSHLKNTETTSSVAEVLRLRGKESNATLSAALSAGDTSISLSTSLGRQVMRGDTILIGNKQFISSQFHRHSETTLYVEPARFSAASGATVELIEKTNINFYGGSITGGYRSVYINAAETTNKTVVAKFTGSVFKGYGREAVRWSTSFAYLEGCTFENGGLERIDAPTLDTADVYCGNGAAGSVQGARFGVGTDYMNRNVIHTTKAEGVAFRDNIHYNYVNQPMLDVAPTQTGRAPVIQNCYTSTGTLVV